MFPWAFLAVSLVGAWFTFNAFFPQLRRGVMTVPSFFAGWLTSELAAHHILWQGVATGAFVWAGALDAWPGWLGLAISVVSWVGLIFLMLEAHSQSSQLETALVDGLGDGYRDRFEPAQHERLAESFPRSRLLLPFWLHDGMTVHRTKEIPYVDGGGHRQCLDVYAPRFGTSNAPVLFQIHGGAWIIGDKNQQALPLMNHLAAQGWVCVSTNYRLSPRATFPDHLIDVKRALCWVRENIARFGGDPDFIVATGGSAGGHLSSMVGLTAGDLEYQPGFESADTTVRAVVPFYGVYDFTNTLGHETHDGLENFLASRVMKRTIAEDPEAYERASPLHRIHDGAPPFYVVHGSHDSLAPVSDAREFAQRLRRASRHPVVYAELARAQHAFEIFHSPRTAHVVRSVDRFLSAIHASYRAERAAA
jgi:acetyl esterase/lipase